MNRVLLVLCFGGIAFTSQAQLVSSSCEAPPEIAAMYAADAQRLALRWTIQTGSPYVDSVTIDPWLTDKMQAALNAVYNAGSLDARDSVTICYELHTLQQPMTNCLMVAVDGDQAWTAQVEQGIFPTSNSAFNMLVSTYMLEYGTYYNWTMGDAFILNTAYNYNLPALCNEFSSVEGVEYAVPNDLVGGGNDIYASVQEDFVELQYRMAWEDCEAGCIRNHNWQFRVYMEDCSVEFVNSWGDLVEVACASGVEEKECAARLFPNPSSGTLFLQSCSRMPVVDIYDATGKLWIHQRVENNTLSLTGLPQGVYFIAVSDDDGTRQTLPFIRQ